jgi:threonylcarbamoyladenosine tRNA methylthiotransferase MtaB
MRNRFDRMRVVSYGVSYLYRKAFREKILDVLVESSRDRTTGMLCGYTDNYIKVHLDGPESLMKRLVQVRIKDLNLIYTLGEYAEGGPS